MTHTTPEIEEIVNLKEWRELQATLDAIWCERPVPVPEHDLLERLARSLITKHQEELEKARQEEKKDFEGAFMNNGINGVLDDQFQDPKMLLIRKHFTTAMQRACEAGRAEIVKEVEGMKDARGDME